jgi:hypothetical protein
MPRIEYGYLDHNNVTTTIPAAGGTGPDTCSFAAAAVGGPPGSAAFAASVATGNPQQNLPHLRFFGGAASANSDVIGYFDGNGHQWLSAITQASTAYPPNIGLPGHWAGMARGLRSMIGRSCRRTGVVAGISLVRGTPLIDYILVGANLISRLETNERIGLSYFMGVLFHFYVIKTAGFTHVIHTKLLDITAPPIAPAGGAYGQGSQYLAGNKPDFLACSLIAAGGGHLHVLEAKGRMQQLGATLATARGILGPAIDQCLRYTGFRIPAAGIPLPAGLGAAWGPAALLFAAPAAGNANAVPASRVATLASWERTTDRWRIWVADPDEEVPAAGPEFTDGFLRLYYAQYKPYFDLDIVDKSDFATITYQGAIFETVRSADLEMRVGVDKRILDLLRNEPEAGYAVGHISQQIMKFMTDYTNTDNDLDAFVSKEGIYSANLFPNPPNNANRVTPPAA